MTAIGAGFACAGFAALIAGAFMVGYGTVAALA